MILYLYLYPLFASVLATLVWRVLMLYMFPYTYHHQYVADRKAEVNTHAAVWILSPVLNVLLPFVMVFMCGRSIHAWYRKSEHHQSQQTNETQLAQYYRDQSFRKTFPLCNE